MACDMHGWSVAMPLIEEMATQMDSSIWSTCQTYTSYRYNNRAQKMLGYGRQLFGAFLLCALSSVLHKHRGGTLECCLFF